MIISLKSPIVKESYLFHIRNLIHKNNIQDGLIYLQITRGVAQRDFKFPKNVNSSIVITAKNISMENYHSKFENLDETFVVNPIFGKTGMIGLIFVTKSIFKSPLDKTLYIFSTKTSLFPLE